uniref:Uncharacterized protein n=1 Tax=Plectus sambesii TaxID=2011161 RepID=A0A914XFJ3_9BILA
MLIIICFLFSVPLIYGQSTTTSPPYKVDGCSSHCRKTDKDLSCWEKTLSFYEQTVLGEMQNFVIIQTNMVNWQRQHDSTINTSNLIDQMKNNSIDALTKANSDMDNDWNDDEDNEKNVLAPDTIATTVHALIENVRRLTTQSLPKFDSFCPIGCEEPFGIWRYLFFASAGLNAALAVAVVPFVFLRAKRDHDNSSSAEPMIKK